MSAFGGKADIIWTRTNVCFLPKADMSQPKMLRCDGYMSLGVVVELGTGFNLTRHAVFYFVITGSCIARAAVPIPSEPTAKLGRTSIIGLDFSRKHHRPACALRHSRIPRLMSQKDQKATYGSRSASLIWEGMLKQSGASNALHREPERHRR